MKKVFLILTAITLTACADSGVQTNTQPGQPAQQAPVQQAPAPSFVKAEKNRPQALPDFLASTAPCSVDGIGEKPAVDVNTVTDKTKLKLSGWAGNVAEGTSPQEVWIEFVGPEKGFVKASSGLKRSDVASALGKPGLENSGWEALADLSVLAGGKYSINVVMLDGKNGLTCNTKRAIQLT